jgi:hypothetical protein
MVPLGFLVGSFSFPYFEMGDDQFDDATDDHTRHHEDAQVSEQIHDQVSVVHLVS